ncbi:MAG: cation:proton antiporter [Myxococcaceae bacterium]|nr:cation:proton antiporter [Myxococcaceae bacterium]
MSGWQELVCHGVLGTLGVSLLLPLYRLVRGPSLTDRVVALDLLALQVAGLIIVYSVYTGHSVLLDVALTLAIISSLGTIVIARYLFSGPGGQP